MGRKPSAQRNETPETINLPVDVRDQFAVWCDQRKIVKKGLLAGLIRWIMSLPADQRWLAYGYLCEEPPDRGAIAHLLVEQIEREQKADPDFKKRYRAGSKKNQGAG